MDILYYDKDIAVCIKPVGMDSEKQTAEALKEILKGEIYPVHRLDMNVGGVMVFARSKAAAAALSKIIQEKAMMKEYVAMVHGTPPSNGDWEDFLWKDSKKNKVYAVKRMRGGVKKARLEFWRLSADETSLVRVRLHTGRSHQIRIQFASRGFPLVGDHKYGAKDKASAPMLFSCRIAFSYKGRTYDFEKLPKWAES